MSAPLYPSSSPPAQHPSWHPSPPQFRPSEQSVWAPNARSTGTRGHTKWSLDSQQSQTKGLEIECCEVLQGTFTISSDICPSIHPSVQPRQPLLPTSPSPRGIPPVSRLGWVCPGSAAAVPTSLPARLQKWGWGTAAAPLGHLPYPLPISQRPQSDGSSSPFPPQGGSKVPSGVWGGLQCFPLPPQTGNWHRVEFNQSSFARGPGSDPITTRWQCSPGRSHAPPAHPLFNQGADKAVIFFPPPDLPKEPQRRGLGRRVMPGLWSGLEEATRTKEQEKEQFPSREVGTGSRYGVLSSVVAFCLSQQCEAFASSKHPPSSQIAGRASARGSHPTMRIFRTPRRL